MRKYAIFICIVAALLGACGGDDSADPKDGPAPIPDGPLARSLRSELAKVGSDPVPAFAQMLEEDVFLSVCSSSKAERARRVTLDEQQKSFEDGLVAPMTKALNACAQAAGEPCHTFTAEDWNSVLTAANQIARLAEAFRLYEGGRDPSDMVELFSSLLPLLNAQFNDWISAHNRPADDSIKAEAESLSNASALVGGFTSSVQSFGYDGFQLADAAAMQMRNLRNSLERISGVMAAADFSAADKQPYIEAIMPAAKAARRALNSLNALHGSTQKAADTCPMDVVWTLLEPIGAVRAQVRRLEACVQSGSCAVDTKP